MNVRQLFKLLLALLVSAGLTIAPLATPAAAEHLMPATMMPMADMSADMPCCPDKQKSNGCQDCPLVAICMLMVLQTGPSTDAIAMGPPARERLHALDDVMADELARPPPDHPPRHLV
ncbi:hypothetical protein V1283_003024 [Bradyrhizobium sp. AZCC 2262]|uniref:hypothetical protein n=1 Tax=Bradyrhizobium sp. AZCC 2262 TaxID=3117022 RepID=UPI002FF222C7